jgi:hypothetical protein
MMMATRTIGRLGRYHGAGGHRDEADGCSLSQRVVEGVAQVKEPGVRCAGTRGGVVLTSANPAFMVEMEDPTKASNRLLGPPAVRTRIPGADMLRISASVERSASENLGKRFGVRCPPLLSSHEGVKGAVFTEFGARAPCGFRKPPTPPPMGGVMAALLIYE